MSDQIQQCRDALSGASAATDEEIAIIYIAAARARLEAARRDVDSLSAIVAAREAEIVRRAHGDARQLEIGGAK